VVVVGHLLLLAVLKEVLVVVVGHLLLLAVPKEVLIIVLDRHLLLVILEEVLVVVVGHLLLLVILEEVLVIVGLNAINILANSFSSPLIYLGIAPKVNYHPIIDYGDLYIGIY
jgi:hypothetical protein